MPGRSHRRSHIACALPSSPSKSPRGRSLLQGALKEAAEIAADEGKSAKRMGKKHPFLDAPVRAKKAAGFSPVLHAGRAFAVSSALTVGLFSTTLCGTAYLFGVTSPQDATDKLRVWAPKQRRRFMRFLGAKEDDKPLFTPSAPKLSPEGLTPDQEWAR